jgi:hypothetical protein
MAEPHPRLRKFAEWVRRRRPDAEASRGGEVDVEMRAIASSNLFDPSFYLIEGPDVQQANLDPIFHFCVYGWREGRRPNLYFDPLWYRDRYLGGPRSQLNPLAHYIGVGESAGCRPICFFDPLWYKTAYALAYSESALRHYLAHRRSQRFAPNAHFDLEFYLARYGAEIGPNRDPFAHLLRCGADRDLDPSPTFDSAAYRRVLGPNPLAPSSSAASERNIPFIRYLEILAGAPSEYPPL